MSYPRIAFIGFGEAAQAFVQGWRGGKAPELQAYDILFEDAARAAAKRRQCLDLGVIPSPSAVAAAENADIVISAVTADQVQQAAASILPAARQGLIFLDINSAAPFRKTAAALPLAEKAVSVVDVAVMAPVHPRLHKTPLLLSGPGAEAVAPLLQSLGMVFEIVSANSGDASTIKMVRSIAIKGIESVAMECMVAAVKFGISERVVPSITEYLANKDFATLADHVMERVVVHGKRRAAEMREVAATLEAAGLSRFMPQATAQHQQWVSELDLVAAFGGKVPHKAEEIARALLAALEKDAARNAAD